MEKQVYIDLVKNSKEDLLDEKLSMTSYNKKLDLLQNLINRRKVILLSLKLNLFLLFLGVICIFIFYTSIFRNNNTPQPVFILIFCFFAFSCPIYLIISCIQEYIKIRKAYKKFNTTHKKMKNYLEMQIELQENEFYNVLDRKKCNDLSKVIYEHLAIDMNLDASMSERVAESVRKNLERFVFRDPSPKKVSKYYDLIDRD